jgi:hypothetical protein
MSVPPPPNFPPSNGRGPSSPRPGAVPPHVTNLNKSRTRNGGGFNPSVNPTLNISVPGGGGGHNGATAAGHGSAGQQHGSVPGADFMSNDDIRAYCEYRRKQSRSEATEIAMDADHLEAVLKTIPDSTGSRSGSRARARRVSRWLKKAAAAEKAQQKYFAMVYGTFEREYEADLRKIGKGRTQQNVRQKFSWT